MGKVENEKASCPSGGTYSEGASAFHTVICSKHKEETFSYTYTDKSWADMEKDRSAFLLQLTKDLQSLVQSKHCFLKIIQIILGESGQPV